jgi:formate hydrogenlyase subunit 3/multisubunit Na+/H+ antiporter MnhD subunit
MEEVYVMTEADRLAIIFLSIVGVIFLFVLIIRIVRARNETYDGDYHHGMIYNPKKKQLEGDSSKIIPF